MRSGWTRPLFRLRGEPLLCFIEGAAPERECADSLLRFPLTGKDAQPGVLPDPVNVGIERCDKYGNRSTDVLAIREVDGLMPCQSNGHKVRGHFADQNGHDAFVQPTGTIEFPLTEFRLSRMLT